MWIDVSSRNCKKLMYFVLAEEFPFGLSMWFIKNKRWRWSSFHKPFKSLRIKVTVTGGNISASQTGDVKTKSNNVIWQAKSIHL